METWDPQIVLNHLKGYPYIKEMTLKQLTLKMTMIMALITAQRTQTLCHVKPNGPASKDTISRWLKQVMTAAGIDTSIFKPHSTRSAATSAAKVADVPLDEIMATAGWRSSSVFAVFYNKPLSTNKSFVNGVLGKD